MAMLMLGLDKQQTVKIKFDLEPISIVPVGLSHAMGPSHQ
jgi:hypothetical protein